MQLYTISIDVESSTSAEATTDGEMLSGPFLVYFYRTAQVQFIPQS